MLQQGRVARGSADDERRISELSESGVLRQHTKDCNDPQAASGCPGPAVPEVAMRLSLSHSLLHSRKALQYALLSGCSAVSPKVWCPTVSKLPPNKCAASFCMQRHLPAIWTPAPGLLRSPCCTESLRVVLSFFCHCGGVTPHKTCCKAFTFHGTEKSTTRTQEKCMGLAEDPCWLSGIILTAAHLFDTREEIVSSLSSRLLLGFRSCRPTLPYVRSQQGSTGPQRHRHKAVCLSPENCVGFSAQSGETADDELLWHTNQPLSPREKPHFRSFPRTFCMTEEVY